VEVAAHGEMTGQEVPCLLIATKDDLEPDSSCSLNAARVWSELLISPLCLFGEGLVRCVLAGETELTTIGVLNQRCQLQYF